MFEFKNWVGACAAALLLAGCGGGSATPCTTARVDDTVTITCPDGTTTELHDGANGVDGDDGMNGKDGEPGEPGDNGTSCTAELQTDGTRLISCSDGTSIVVEDGKNGKDGTDGTDGKDGADGANGHSALVTMAGELPGANCANGGTVINAGLDLNDDGVLDTTEITSTQYVCRPDAYALDMAFVGYDDLTAGLRGEVQVNGRLYGAFDPATLVRWQYTVTDGAGAPVAGVRSYYAVPGDSTVHTDWTTFVETDSNGQAFFGPSTGFTVAQSGLLNLGGATIPFSVISPVAGAQTMELTLVRLGDGAKIGGATISYTVAAAAPEITFDGFDALTSGSRNLVTVTARVPAGTDPTALFRWRLTLQVDGAPLANQTAFYPLPGEETAAHTTWTGAFETDSAGISWFGPSAGFTVGQAGLDSPAGTTTPFSVQFAPGAYDFQLELVDLSTMTAVGTASTTFTVP